MLSCSHKDRAGWHCLSRRAYFFPSMKTSREKGQHKERKERRGAVSRTVAIRFSVCTRKAHAFIGKDGGQAHNQSKKRWYQIKTNVLRKGKENGVKVSLSGEPKKWGKYRHLACAASYSKALMVMEGIASWSPPLTHQIDRRKSATIPRSASSHSPRILLPPFISSIMIITHQNLF